LRLNFFRELIKATALKPSEYLAAAKGYTIVDVRSPDEFKKGHIPGAINIPIFDNDERAEIGIVYKISGKEIAVERGLEIISPKLLDLVTKTKRLSGNQKIFVYCWRGGMRSQSFAWLMNTAGLQAQILDGGYKIYRNHVLNFFETNLKILLLGGPTGSGKSAVLRELKEAGQQIVDLEALAHHKGSAFGSINEAPQNPQQLFEHNLFNAFQSLDLSKDIWLEDEAMALGWNKIPFALWKQMKLAPIFKINVPFDIRVERLVADYSTTDHSLLFKALCAIKDKLGGQHFQAAAEKLNQGDLHAVAAIALKYYDEAYEFNHLKREMKNIIPVLTQSGDEKTNCLLVLERKNKFSLASASL
jgi:tRNA 2-selenouridine synthase